MFLQTPLSVQYNRVKTVQGCTSKSDLYDLFSLQKDNFKLFLINYCLREG